MATTIPVSDSLVANPSGLNASNSSYSSISSSYPITNAYANADSTSYAYITCNTGSQAVTRIALTFDLSSIPANATIDSVACSAKARVSSTSYISTAYLQLYNNTTAMGSTTSARTTSATKYNLTCGTWTRAQLNNLELRYTGTRGTSNTTRAAYLYFYGADLTINYTYNQTAYTITTSCIGGSITPSTIDVIEGDSQSFRIESENGTTNLTGLTVNGVNVLSQAVKKTGGSASYSVDEYNGADYGFSLNANNYYQSENKGKANSAALCRVNFNLSAPATVNFYVINYAEATYDFGILGNIDEPLEDSISLDSSYFWAGSTSAKNTASEQLVSYDMFVGEHFVDIKYKKDSYTDSNNDTLQFRIEIIMDDQDSTDTWYYEYILENVSADTTILATFNAIYIKVNGT